jgi:chemotaxis protein methyltransferase CheR
VDGSPVRVWSAACSSGEEVYTLAMVLEDLRREGRIPEWEVLGTDLSPRVLERAASGRFPIERAQEIPEALRKRYALRGTGPDEGTLLLDRALRERCSFAKVNLTLALPDVGRFDVVFLRNVLIYFDVATKRQVVTALFAHLRPGGLLFTGLAESLHGVCDARRMDAPGVYRPSVGAEPTER